MRIVIGQNLVTILQPTKVLIDAVKKVESGEDDGSELDCIMSKNISQAIEQAFGDDPMCAPVVTDIGTIQFVPIK